MRTIMLAATIEFGRIHSANKKASAWPVSLLHHLLLVIIVSSEIPVSVRWEAWGNTTRVSEVFMHVSGAHLCTNLWTN